MKGQHSYCSNSGPLNGKTDWTMRDEKHPILLEFVLVLLWDHISVRGRAPCGDGRNFP